MKDGADSVRQPPPLPVYRLLSMEHFSIDTEHKRLFQTPKQSGLLIVEKGRGKISAELMLIEPGDSLLIDSMRELELEACSEIVSGYFIHFQSVTSSGEQDIISNVLDRFRVLHMKPSANYLREIRSMYAALEQCNEPLQQLRLQLQFQTILYEVCKTGLSVMPDKDSLHAVRKSIAYLQAHYDEEHNVAQLANQLNLSNRHYTRLFKRLTGKSPIEFLNEYRINRSKELLLLKNEPSHHISAQIGMRDVTYFNRRFKQRVGCSPKEYVRKRHMDSRIVTTHYAGEILALGMVPLGSLDHALEQLQPDAPAIRSIGYDTCQFNEIKALQPDLIIASDFTDRAELAALGELAPVIVIPWDMDALERLQRVARVLGKQEEAEGWMERYRTQSLIARSECSSLISKAETAAIVRMEEGRVWVHASRFFPVFYDVIGFQPTSLMQQTTEVHPDLRRVAVPLHQIEKLEASRIYIVENDRASFPRLFEQLQKADSWQTLTAVRNRQVYRLGLQGILYSAYTLEWQLGQVSRLIAPVHEESMSGSGVALLL